MGYMGVDVDSCETGLVLGLGVTTTTPTADLSSSLAPAQRMEEPSLTLSLFGKTCRFDPMTNEKVLRSDEIQSVDLSAASSLSNASVKRERDTGTGGSGSGSEEVETEADRISSRLSDEDDDDGSNNRKKLRLTKAQSALLEESFKHHTTLNPKQKQDLARELKLRPRQVEVWFQNRRARTKLKQTEVECEVLKKWCDTLSDENQRLQKELQELKAFKLAQPQPLYMQLPAATLSMCPSCQRIGGAAAAKPSFATPRFYNPFTNPSAAC